MSVLKIKDANGNWVGVASIKGTPGAVQTVDGVSPDADGEVTIGATRQYTTMPLSATAGDVVMYVGITSATYTNGHLYRWSGAAWVEIPFGDPNSVSYDAQSKTVTQKAQARTNIGAADVAAFSAHYTNGVVDGLGLGTPATGSGSVDVADTLNSSLRIAIGAASNRNLLDNWDFRNPVNQREVSGTISSAGYFIDRWKLTSGSVTLTADGLTLNGTIAQPLERAAGTSVTASVRMHSGEATASYDNSTKTFTITSTGGTIAGAKLELGSVSTLANDPPADFSEQLALCQRYLIKLPQYSVIFGSQSSADAVDLHLYLPVSMRITPSVVGSGLSTIGGVSGFTLGPATTPVNNSFCRLRATKTAHGLIGFLFAEVTDNATYLSAEM